jgi:hypothetical protein
MPAQRHWRHQTGPRARDETRGKSAARCAHATALFSDHEEERDVVQAVLRLAVRPGWRDPTQFDPQAELRFLVSADPRYTNRASVTFDDHHRILLHRVAR